MTSKPSMIQWPVCTMSCVFYVIYHSQASVPLSPDTSPVTDSSLGVYRLHLPVQPAQITPPDTCVVYEMINDLR